MANLNSPNELGFALRDYHHAAKTFTQEPGYTKTPYTGFNFHVNISFNNLLGKLRGIETKDISVLVRAADLPETQFETETLNQYNRKRIINKRVIYQPVKIEFHDDIANNIRNMWIAYNQHYNADSKYTLNSTWNIDDVYANYSLNRKYGLDNGNSLPFINKLEIFSMGNNEYSKMLLVNPVINSAAFDDHDYSEGAKTMSLTLTVEYENIIYSAGTTDQIANFGSNNPENYDQNISDMQPTDLANSVSDQAVEPRTKTKQQVQAEQVDTTSGNVKKSNTRDKSQLSQLQYNRIKEQLVQSQQSASFYLFPDSESRSQGENGILENYLVDGVPLFNSTVISRREVSSNGTSISTSSVVNRNETEIEVQYVSNTNPNTVASENQLQPEIVINPIIPDNLTAAERALFIKSYPPLPSTDRRTSQAPYV